MACSTYELTVIHKHTHWFKVDGRNKNDITPTSFSEYWKWTEMITLKINGEPWMINTY